MSHYGAFEAEPEVQRASPARKYTGVGLVFIAAATALVAVSSFKTGFYHLKFALFDGVNVSDMEGDDRGGCPPWPEFCLEQPACVNKYHSGSKWNPLTSASSELDEYYDDCKSYCTECDCPGNDYCGQIRYAFGDEFDYNNMPDNYKPYGSTPKSWGFHGSGGDDYKVDPAILTKSIKDMTVHGNENPALAPFYGSCEWVGAGYYMQKNREFPACTDGQVFFGVSDGGFCCESNDEDGCEAGFEGTMPGDEICAAYHNPIPGEYEYCDYSNTTDLCAMVYGQSTWTDVDFRMTMTFKGEAAGPFINMINPDDPKSDRYWFKLAHEDAGLYKIHGGGKLTRMTPGPKPIHEWTFRKEEWPIKDEIGNLDLIKAVVYPEAGEWAKKAMVDGEYAEVDAEARGGLGWVDTDQEAVESGAYVDEDEKALILDGHSIVKSDGPGGEALTRFTLAAWVAPATLTQRRPAGIFGVENLIVEDVDSRDADFKADAIAFDDGVENAYRAHEEKLYNARKGNARTLAEAEQGPLAKMEANVMDHLVVVYGRNDVNSAYDTDQIISVYLNGEKVAVQEYESDEGSYDAASWDVVLGAVAYNNKVTRAPYVSGKFDTRPPAAAHNGRWTCDDNCFEGKIFKATMWDVPLSYQEVAALYNDERLRQGLLLEEGETYNVALKSAYGMDGWTPYSAWYNECAHVAGSWGAVGSKTTFSVKQEHRCEETAFMPVRSTYLGCFHDDKYRDMDPDALYSPDRADAKFLRQGVPGPDDGRPNSRPAGADSFPWGTRGWAGGDAKYTVKSCGQACKDYAFFALQGGGMCFCDNSYGDASSGYDLTYAEVDSGLCDTEDTARSKTGGEWYNSIYSNDSLDNRCTAPDLEKDPDSLTKKNSGCHITLKMDNDLHARSIDGYVEGRSITLQSKAFGKYQFGVLKGYNIVWYGTDPKDESTTDDQSFETWEIEKTEVQRITASLNGVEIVDIMDSTVMAGAVGFATFHASMEAFGVRIQDLEGAPKGATPLLGEFKGSGRAYIFVDGYPVHETYPEHVDMGEMGSYSPAQNKDGVPEYSKSGYDAGVFDPLTSTNDAFVATDLRVPRDFEVLAIKVFQPFYPGYVVVKDGEQHCDEAGFAEIDNDAACRSAALGADFEDGVLNIETENPTYYPEENELTAPQHMQGFDEKLPPGCVTGERTEVWGVNWKNGTYPERDVNGTVQFDYEVIGQACPDDFPFPDPMNENQDFGDKICWTHETGCSAEGGCACEDWCLLEMHKDAESVQTFLENCPENANHFCAEKDVEYLKTAIKHQAQCGAAIDENNYGRQPYDCLCENPCLLVPKKTLRTDSMYEPKDLGTVMGPNKCWKEAMDWKNSIQPDMYYRYKANSYAKTWSFTNDYRIKEIYKEQLEPDRCTGMPSHPGTGEGVGWEHNKCDLDPETDETALCFEGCDLHLKTAVWELNPDYGTQIYGVTVTVTAGMAEAPALSDFIRDCWLSNNVAAGCDPREAPGDQNEKEYRCMAWLDPTTSFSKAEFESCQQACKEDDADDCLKFCPGHEEDYACIKHNQQPKVFSAFLSDHPATTLSGGGKDHKDDVVTNPEGAHDWTCIESNVEPKPDGFGIKWYEPHYNLTANRQGTKWKRLNRFGRSALGWQPGIVFPKYTSAQPVDMADAGWMGATTHDEHSNALYCVLHGGGHSQEPTDSILLGGSFESPEAKTWNTASNQDANRQSPPGWVVEENEVDWGKFQQMHNMCTSDCAYDGVQFIDLCGQDVGSISQTVPTIKDQQYVLSYAINAHPTCGNPEKVTNVYVRFDNGEKKIIAVDHMTRHISKAAQKDGYSGIHPYFGWVTFPSAWQPVSHNVTARGEFNMTIGFDAVDEDGSCGCMDLDDIKLMTVEAAALPRNQ